MEWRRLGIATGMYVPPRSGGPRSAAARRKRLCNSGWPVHLGGDRVQAWHMCVCLSVAVVLCEEHSVYVYSTYMYMYRVHVGI